MLTRGTARTMTVSALALVALALAGCSPAPKAPASADEILTCDGFVAADPDVQKSFVLREADTDDLDRLAFDETGAHETTLIDLVLLACGDDPDLSVDAVVDDVQNRYVLPPCQAFSAQTPDIQDAWAAAALKGYLFDPGLGDRGNAVAVLAGCDRLAALQPSASGFWDSVRELDALAKEDPVKYEQVVGAPAPGDGLAHYGAWANALAWETVSNLGYDFRSILAFDALSHEVTADEGFAVGSVCGLGDGTDTFLDASWITYNETARSAVAKSALVFSASGAETVTLAVEVGSASGAQCFEIDGSTPVSLESTQAIDPGQSTSTPVHLILRNYFSPRYPEGNAADLGRLLITASPYVDTGDPVASTRTASVRLDGSHE